MSRELVKQRDTVCMFDDDGVGGTEMYAKGHSKCTMNDKSTRWSFSGADSVLSYTAG